MTEVNQANSVRPAIALWNSKTGNFHFAAMDGITTALSVIDYEHHEVHAGSAFYYTDAVELASAAVQDYVIQTPNTKKWAHMTFSATGSAITQVQLYEGGDRTPTTPQTIFNNNRNSSAAPGLQVYKGQSGGSTDGTLIWMRKSGAADGASRSGAEATHTDELILKQNTQYIVRITSGTNANLCNLLLSWYEHTDLA